MSGSRIRREEGTCRTPLGEEIPCVRFFCRQSGLELANFCTDPGGLSHVNVPGFRWVSPGTARLVALAVELACREVAP